MKHVRTAGLIFLIIFLYTPVVMAQWSGWVGWHSGTIAADEDAMKEKFKTVDELVKAAMATTNPMMKEIQQNKEAIETAAKELGLKEEQAPKK